MKSEFSQIEMVKFQKKKKTEFLGNHLSLQSCNFINSKNDGQ